MWRLQQKEDRDQTGRKMGGKRAEDYGLLSLGTEISMGGHINPG